MINNKLPKLLIFFIILKIFGQFVTIECKPAPKHGRGKSFGVGVLAGGLAGAALKHILSNKKPTQIHHVHNIVYPGLPPPKPTTIIEQGPILPNGCHKQIIKEPDQRDMSRFIETEQLICPQNVSPQTVVHQVPALTIQQPQPVEPTVHMIQMPISLQPEAPRVINSNYQPQQPNQISTLSSNGVQSVPVISVANPSIVHTMQPVTPFTTATAQTPQVIVLSKKTGSYGKQRNASNRLFASTFSFLLSAIIIIRSVL